VRLVLSRPLHSPAYCRSFLYPTTSYIIPSCSPRSGSPFSRGSLCQLQVGCTGHQVCTHIYHVCSSLAHSLPGFIYLLLQPSTFMHPIEIRHVFCADLTLLTTQLTEPTVLDVATLDGVIEGLPITASFTLHSPSLLFFFRSARLMPPNRHVQCASSFLELQDVRAVETHTLWTICMVLDTPTRYVYRGSPYAVPMPCYYVATHVRRDQIDRCVWPYPHQGVLCTDPLTRFVFIERNLHSPPHPPPHLQHLHCTRFRIRHHY
jgi:hypothetical protein